MGSQSQKDAIGSPFPFGNALDPASANYARERYQLASVLHRYRTGRFAHHRGVRINLHNPMSRTQ